jgi:hypothetical protein
MRRSVAVATAAVCAAAAAPGQAAAKPPGLTLARAGQTAQATVGSFCAAGMCVDRAAPPVPQERLPVHRGARVRLRFTLPADTVQVHLIRIRADGSARIGRKLHAERVTGKRWRVRLPQRLHRANGLDVFARGGGWDAGFWGGLRRTH